MGKQVALAKFRRQYCGSKKITEPRTPRRRTFTPEQREHRRIWDRAYYHLNAEFFREVARRRRADPRHKAMMRVLCAKWRKSEKGRFSNWENACRRKTMYRAASGKGESCITQRGGKKNRRDTTMAFAAVVEKELCTSIKRFRDRFHGNLNR